MSGLLGPARVRELAERLSVAPTKKLGQNFVVDPNTVRKIVRLAGIEPGDEVIEIGPGLGSLTLGLLEQGARVTAVEIDERLASALTHTARTMQPGLFAPESDGQRTGQPLTVIREDALQITAAHFALENEGGSEATRLPTRLVANLPYNVSVPILMHLLQLLPTLTGGLVMVQAEVGQRIAAQPGSKAYGAPSAKAAWYGEWSIAGTVSRRIFWPVPGVDSVLVAYQRRAEPRGSEALRSRTFELVNAAFAQRRKMLRQALQPLFGDAKRAAEAIASAGVDPTARAEQLGIEQYLAIARV